MADAAFSASPGAPVDHWRLDGNLLEGPFGVMDLAAVRSAVFVDVPDGARRLVRLDLTANDLRVRVTSRGPVGAGDALAHFILLRSIAKRLAEVQPSLSITIGMRRRMRLARFLGGVLALVVAAGIAAFAARVGLSGDRMALAALPMLGLGGWGIVLVQANRPWGTGLRIPATLFPALLDAGGTPDADR